MATKVKNKVSGNKPSDKTVTKKNDRSLYITNDGTYIMKNSFEIDELDILKKELNILPKVTNDFAIEKNEPFDIFLEGTDKLYIPKFYGLKKFDNIKNTVTPNNPLNFTFNGDLRDYQKEIVNIVLPKIKKDGGGLLSVPTGRGKTVLGLYLATQLKCRTLIIVHKEFLMNQWNERIRQYTNCTIGKIQQNKVDIDKDIVIGMLQSISMKDYDVDIFSKFDFVIFDECHHLSSRVFSQALLKLNTPYTLGLSATPNRSDKTEKVFYWFLGEMMYKEETPLAHKVKVEVHNYTIKDRKFRDAIGKNGKSIQPIVISKLFTKNPNLPAQQTTNRIKRVVKTSSAPNKQNRFSLVQRAKSSEPSIKKSPSSNLVSSIASKSTNLIGMIVLYLF
jgi:hypothetical protein